MADAVWVAARPVHVGEAKHRATATGKYCMPGAGRRDDTTLLGGSLA
jgi:hypothetical protein